MKVYVDADACPVKEIIVNVSRKYNIEVIMVIDTSHILEEGYHKVITVDKSNDSVDFYILGKIKENDILVTQDYGLASIALAKNAKVINQNGFFYTNNNIDELLLKRHISNVIRKSGGRTKNIQKRKIENDNKFKINFEKLFLNNDMK